MKPRYLLDTNICIFIQKEKHPSIRTKLDSLVPGDAAMSVVTWGELMHGAAKSTIKEKVHRDLERLRSLIPVLDMPVVAGDHYGEIRGELQRNGKIIGANDLWIAAHARAEGLRLVTNNTREFQRVPSLTLEDWTQAEA